MCADVLPTTTACQRSYAMGGQLADEANFTGMYASSALNVHLSAKSYTFKARTCEGSVRCGVLDTSTLVTRFTQGSRSYVKTQQINVT